MGAFAIVVVVAVTCPSRPAELCAGRFEIMPHASGLASLPLRVWYEFTCMAHSRSQGKHWQAIGSQGSRHRET